MAAVPRDRESALKTCLDEALQVFKDKIDPDIKPVIATYAPGRVNLIGEHTDYNDGCVLPMALHLVTVVVGRPTANGDKCRVITCSDLGATIKTDVVFQIPDPPTQDEVDSGKHIQLSTPSWCHYIQGVVALMNGNYRGGKVNQIVGVPPFEAVIVSCVPIGGGVSSSAALEVATCLFVEELCKYKGIDILQKSDEEKALLCQKAEHMYAGAPCGIMDQFVSVMAQDNKALFIDCQRQDGKSFPTENVPLTLKEKELVVLVTNSNVKHCVGDGEYRKRRDRCYAACEKMGKQTLRQVTLEEVEAAKPLLLSPVPDGPTEYECSLHVVQEIKRTIEAKDVLKNDDFKQFGRLMNDSHTTLSNTYKVSCFELDKLVELARQDPRVYGSRMTGAGFGGCTVTLLEEGAVESAIQRIKDGYCNENGQRLEAVFFVASPCSGAGVLQI